MMVNSLISHIGLLAIDREVRRARKGDCEDRGRRQYRRDYLTSVASRLLIAAKTTTTTTTATDYEYRSPGHYKHWL